MSRAVCAGCLRPQATCICRFVTPTATACEVLILQHPLEAHHAKNSARLLHLSLPGSRMVVGEVLDDAALQALMPDDKTTVLLYPPTDYEGHAAAAPLDAARLGDLQKVRLVVLDACRAWRWTRCRRAATPSARRTRRGNCLRWRPPARHWRNWRAMPPAGSRCWKLLTALWRSSVFSCQISPWRP